MLQKSIILFFLSLPLFLSAQNKDTTNVTWRPINLVVNNSFELSVDTARPLTKVEPVPKALGWSIPNKSQPLIYSTNEKGFIHDPNGTDWKFKARSGKNVVGLNIIGIKRDYVQGTLENPLAVGKKYYFAFWVHYHCSGANNIGIAFLPEKINVYVTTRLPLKPATYQKKVVPYLNQPCLQRVTREGLGGLDRARASAAMVWSEGIDDAARDCGPSRRWHVPLLHEPSEWHGAVGPLGLSNHQST